MIIARIRPVSVAKISGTVYAVLGLVLGGIFSLISLTGGFASGASRPASFGPLLGVGAIMIFPILYGGIGFLMALLGAWLYNVMAGFVGGIEMDVQ